MPIRRFLLLAGASLLTMPAWAAERRARHPTAHPLQRATPGVVPTTPLAAEPPTPADTPLGPLDTVAQWAIIIDFNTGATLLTKQANARMPPSSMTKLMTAYIVYSRLASGQLKLDQTLLVSEKAWRMGGSKMFVPLGGQVTVDDLIQGLIVQSGNDAAIVLAEGIAGSEDQFVQIMNSEAKRLGLTNSHFMNCTGWPDPDHYMSCRDIATLAADLIRTFPQYYHYDAEKSFKFNNIEQANRNPLVERGLADGLKTGHTDAGGYGLIASAERNGRRVVEVLNGLTSMHERAQEGERLLEWAFASYEDVTLFAANAPVENAKVWLGTSNTVPLVSTRPIVVTMPQSWRHTAKISVAYTSPIAAPITRGATLGQLTVSGTGVPDAAAVLLVAGIDVPRLGLPGRALAVVTHYITGS
jgi:serine-type D-Ala-D-Ala carboxypeptidase (penicillin-binding protein 5/6)